MATTTKGRYGAKARPTYGSFAGFSWGGSPSVYGGNNYGTYGKKGNNSSGRKNTSKKTGSVSTSAYKTCCNTFEQKIQSFKTLCAQAQGSGSTCRPTPSTLNSFANLINKGAVIQTVSTQQVARWARATNKNFNPRNPSPMACKTIMTKKFGKSAIKAVARCKNGTFMVATNPTINGRTFTLPR